MSAVGTFCLGLLGLAIGVATWPAWLRCGVVARFLCRVESSKPRDLGLGTHVTLEAEMNVESAWHRS